MNQRQLNMINAIELGLREAQAQLADPLAEDFMREALEAFVDDSQVSMGLTETARLAALLLAWRDRGCPDLLT